MVRERIKELVDFATTESPYRDANKGWITDDVFVEFGASPQTKSAQGVELANVSVFWKPINQLASILLTVILLATIFVFIALSISHGKLKMPVLTDEQTSVSTKLIVEPEIQSEPSQENKNISTTNASSELLIAESINSENSLRNSEFAAAALGGQKVQRNK